VSHSGGIPAFTEEAWLLEMDYNVRSGQELSDEAEARINRIYMTESFWVTTCNRCGEWLGPGRLEDAGGSFIVMPGTKCKCPPRLRVPEIKPHDWFIEQELSRIAERKLSQIDSP
jgi:hypothetical protein